MSIPPLQDLVVLDFTRFLSGPYASMLLADAGARVIKIEPPGGEETRELSPLIRDSDGTDISSYFLRLNRRKESLCLDLRNDADKAHLIQLVTIADIVIENYSADVMTRLGLNDTVLKQINPRLIYCSISGFGHTVSPARNWPAFNLVAEAMAGALARDATGADTPMPLGPPLGDTYASLFGVIGILMALERRRKSGIGSTVDISMYDCAMALNEMALGVASSSGLEMAYGRQDGVHRNPDLAPYGYFPVADGWICIAVGPDRQWKKLCQMMGRVDLAEDERLESGKSRVLHFTDLIEPVLKTWLAPQHKEAVAKLLAEAGIPSGPVRNAKEVLDAPETQARGMLVPVRTPGGEIKEFVNSPVHFTPDFDLGEARVVRPGHSPEEIIPDASITGGR